MSSVKERIQKKLDVSDKEFEKVCFGCLWLSIEYLSGRLIVINYFGLRSISSLL
jgi:hypothetical protein